MILKTLEDRMAALEADVARLKKKMGEEETPWWKQIAGTFEDDPYHAEAMRLGRKYRESLRPKAVKKRRDS
jgi:hypothetical protein